VDVREVQRGLSADVGSSASGRARSITCVTAGARLD